jgi:ATPases involved in chromosome partitioning
MKLLVAVGREDIERYLSQQYDVSVVRHLEGVPWCLEQVEPDIVVITHHLPGMVKIYDVLWTIRTHPKSPRVIYLAGDRDTVNLDYLNSLVAMGIYDILFNPFQFEDIDRLIRQPNTMADAVQLLDMHSAPTIQKKEPLTLQKSHAHVVAVWSPTSSGASFIGLNLAAAVAMNGHSAAYVDVSEERAAHVWLDLPDFSALEALAKKGTEARGFETRIPGLALFTEPPARNNSFGEAIVRQLRQLPYDVVVLDVGSREHYLTEHHIDEVWLVTDADPLHLMQAKAASQSLLYEHPDLHLRVVWNRDDDSLDDKAFPFKADLRVPLYSGVYGWLHRSEFAVMHDQELKQKIISLVPMNKNNKEDIESQVDLKFKEHWWGKEIQKTALAVS